MWTGRECGTSASNAPIDTTICVPSASARSTTNRQNVRQRMDGSLPDRRMRSRGARGTRAAKISSSGQSISRVRPSTIRTFGRVAWKSKNSSGSMRAKRSAFSADPTNCRAADAASPASFQPLNAHTSAGARSPSGRVSHSRGGIRSNVEDDPVRPSIATLQPGHAVEGVFACSRKDRLVARTGSPYLAVELRDRTGTIAARAFRDADVLAGRFDRGDLVSVRGRVERFRDELQIELQDIARAPASEEADPPRSCPSPTATSTSSTASSSTSPARSTTRSTRRCSRGCSATPRCAPSGAARRARATATTPTSAACSSTPSPWRSSPRRRACCTCGSTATCSSAPRWSTTWARPASSPTARRSARRTRGGCSGHVELGLELLRERAAASPSSTASASWRSRTAS
jgi:hypothetical protein